MIQGVQQISERGQNGSADLGPQITLEVHGSTKSVEFCSPSTRSLFTPSFQDFSVLICNWSSQEILQIARITFCNFKTTFWCKLQFKLPSWFELNSPINRGPWRWFRAYFWWEEHSFLDSNRNFFYSSN